MKRRSSYYILFGFFLASMLAAILGSVVWPKGRAVMHVIVARKMLENGKMDSAIEQAKEAAQIAPGSPMIIHYLMLIYSEANMYDEAEKAVEELVRLSPDSAQGYIDLGMLRLARKDVDGAKKAAEKAKSLAPDLAYTYYLVGRIAWYEKDFDSARTNLKKAVEKNPRNYMFLYDLGAFYDSQQEYDQAIDVLKTAVELRPDLSLAHEIMAECYLRKGLYVQALAEYKLVVDLDPSSNWAMYNIACVYSLRDDQEAAVKWLKRSIDNGFKDFVHIRQDPDLGNIRDNPKYKELIEEETKDGSPEPDTLTSEAKAAATSG